MHRHTNTPLAASAVFTCFLAGSILAQAPYVSEGNSFYLVGNSYIGNNGGQHQLLPRAFTNGDVPLTITAQPPGSGYFFGQGLSSMFTAGVRNEIANGNFDVVMNISGPLSAMQTFATAAEDAGSLNLVFMVWEGTHPTTTGQNWITYRNGTTSIINACRSLESSTDALVAPVGAILYDLLADPVRSGMRPDYVFEFDPATGATNIHQNMLGQLVGAYTVYAQLMGESPVGIAFDFDRYIDGSRLFTARVGDHPFVYDQEFREDVQDRVWKILGEWNDGSFTVKPIPDGNLTGRPTADIAADVTSGFAPLTVEFDASGSTDPAGDTLAYEWDFDEGGDFSSGNETASHVFDTPGTYRVGLRASDGTRFDSDFLIINVAGEGANRAPEASLSSTPQSGQAPLECTLDASGSSDPDDDNLSYEWDFGDGAFVPGGAEEVHQFTEEGVYLVRVRVSDGEDADVATIPVSALGRPGTYYRIEISQGASGAWGRISELDFMVGSDAHPRTHFTGNTTEVVATGSNGWQAFDDSTSSFWDLQSPAGTTSIDLGAVDIAADALRVRVTEANRAPGAFTVSRSPDGASWTEVGNFSGLTPTNWEALDLTFPLNPPDSFPVIQTINLPTANLARPYSYTLVASGGDGALEWTVIGGGLPVGLSLSGDGVLSGTPQANGTRPVTVRVMDEDGDSEDADLAIVVLADSPSILATGINSTADGIEAHWQGQTGATIMIETSTNLVQWELLEEITATGGLQTYDLPIDPSEPTLFMTITNL